MAVVERRADAVEGAEVGAQDGEAREGHDQPDEGDESDDADEPGVGRKVPRHTAHEEYKADRYLEYPREPVELAPAEAHHGAHVVPANCQCPGALPPAQAAPEPGPVPGPTLLRAPAADLAPSGDQEHGVPALEPSLATVPREDLNLLECTSVEVGGSSGEVKLSYEMGDLRHDHPKEMGTLQLSSERCSGSQRCLPRRTSSSTQRCASVTMTRPSTWQCC